MDGFEDMKNKFKLKEYYEYNFHFGINIDACVPEDMKTRAINEAIHDLRRTFIESSTLSCTRLYNGSANVILSNNSRDIKFNLFLLLKKAYRYFYRINVPLCLYPQKKDILDHIDETMKRTRTFIRLNISNTVDIYVNGNEKECLIAKTEIINMIEKMLGRETTIHKGYYPMAELIRLGYRVFFTSKINANTIFIAGDRMDINVIKEIDSNFTESSKLFYSLDTLKLNYLLYYQKNSIEDILAKNDCYIEIEDSVFDTTNVAIISFSPLRQRNCKNELDELFQNTIKILLTEYSENFQAKEIFVFENLEPSIYSNNDSIQKRYLAIASKAIINDILGGGTCECEAEIELDPELEEFLCGKKNGKINKIIKDTFCDIAIKTKRDGIIKKMVVFISGMSKNVNNAIELLENEFPAELAFYLHERHHKRIIGYGGKNIQKIMKKHGVYIKFMGEEERMFLGLKGNVIIKTPKKNANSLQKMKEEVLFLADETREEIEIPKIMYNLHDFYDFSFKKFKFYFDRVLVSGFYPPQIFYYKVNLKKSINYINKDKIVILKVKGCDFVFVKSLIPLDEELIDVKIWYDKEPPLSFKMFNSVLLYSYESVFNKDLEDNNYRIEFSERLPTAETLRSDMAVGFQMANKKDSMQ